jgi:hypothetical protein
MFCDIECYKSSRLATMIIGRPIRVEMENIPDILQNLPPENVSPGGGAYGCRRQLSLYCGFKEIPWQGKLTTSGDNWQHGWLPPHYNTHHEIIAMGINGGTYKHRETTRYFVARQDQVDYLKECGYKDVHAIGLPFVYTRDPLVERIPGSLLVLPVHSIEGSHHDRQQKEYAQYIDSIRHRFSTVWISIHPNDLKKGYWVSDFQEKEFPFVTGASFKDSHSLDRMRQLFSTFEFVTTNGFGSHLAYASFCGAKVSICGPFEEDKLEDLKDLNFASNEPEAIRLLASAKSQKEIRKHFGSFFLDPWDAVPRQAWAREQLGFHNIRPRSETKRLLGWDLKSRMTQSLLVRISSKAR